MSVCCRKTAVDPCERVHRAPTFAIQFGDDLAIPNAKVSLLAEGDMGAHWRTANSFTKGTKTQCETDLRQPPREAFEG